VNREWNSTLLTMSADIKPTPRSAAELYAAATRAFSRAGAFLKTLGEHPDVGNDLLAAVALHAAWNFELGLALETLAAT